MIISSLKNPRVKQVIALRTKRERDRTGLASVEGRDEVRLAFESGIVPVSLLFCPALFGDTREPELIDKVRRAGAETVEVSKAVFAKIAYRENPDGWLAVFPAPSRGLADLQLRQPALVVVAESVEKPGNLGAILRSADAVGVDGVIVCDASGDVFNPNVVRSSRGAVFTVPVARAAGEQALAWLKERRVSIVATSPDASTPYTQADLRGPAAIAVGTEKHGLSQTWLREADIVVRIPMNGRVNSLNVATAATLLLYEALRQRSPRLKDNSH